MVSSDNDSTNNNSITCTSSILVATTTNFLKYIIMNKYSYTLLKISFRMFNKHFNKLTKDQQEKVIERYYDYY